MKTPPLSGVFYSLKKHFDNALNTLKYYVDSPSVVFLYRQ